MPRRSLPISDRRAGPASRNFDQLCGDRCSARPPKGRPTESLPIFHHGIYPPAMSKMDISLPNNLKNFVDQPVAGRETLRTEYVHD